MTVASLLMFSSYRVEDGDNVRWTVCKIGCAGNWRLMDVHGVRILKDREAAKYRHMIWFNTMNFAITKWAQREVEVIIK